MGRFLDWFNKNKEIDLVIKAAVAHLWFVTVHPFDDGNGRITRAVTDMLLTQSDKSSQRFYSMSAQIRIERKQYYEMLEKAQKGNLDITDWIVWFLNCLVNALKSTNTTLNKVLFKAGFWNRHANALINGRFSGPVPEIHIIGKARRIILNSNKGIPFFSRFMVQMNRKRYFTRPE